MTIGKKAFSQCAAVPLTGRIGIAWERNQRPRCISRIWRQLAHVSHRCSIGGWSASICKVLRKRLQERALLLMLPWLGWLWVLL